MLYATTTTAAAGSNASATGAVLFINPEDCEKYLRETADGITMPLANGRKHTVRTRRGSQTEVVPGIVREEVERGVTRVVHVDGVGASVSKEAVFAMARKQGRGLVSVSAEKGPAGVSLVFLYLLLLLLLKREISLQDTVLTYTYLGPPRHLPVRRNPRGAFVRIFTSRSEGFRGGTHWLRARPVSDHASPSPSPSPSLYSTPLP